VKHRAFRHVEHDKALADVVVPAMLKVDTELLKQLMDNWSFKRLTDTVFGMTYQLSQRDDRSRPGAEYSIPDTEKTDNCTSR
jgi:hypothetical protein